MVQTEAEVRVKVWRPKEGARRRQGARGRVCVAVWALSQGKSFIGGF